MARQHLNCKRGQHSWSREGTRGKPPQNCPQHDPKASRFAQATVISMSTETVEPVEGSGPAISGVALCDSLMNKLASRGQLLSQQKSHTYSGPRW